VSNTTVPTSAQPPSPFTTNRDSAPAYWFFGSLWVILADVYATGGSYSLMEQWMRSGFGPPPHVHSVDEWFFILEGSMDMQVGGEEVKAGPGDSVWIPRGTEHALKTAEDNTHVLNGYTPGGPEQSVIAVGVPAERRELPPEDFPLPPPEKLKYLMNNFWSVMSDNPVSRSVPFSVPPQR
jgi:mannose-6-phosphate isomerase-like protein (cupin superfamily)